MTVVGRAAVAAGRLEQAAPLIERALALARVANDPTREAEALTRLANAERQQGRMDEARRHAEQALALRDALGQADGVAVYELGIVQRQTGAMQEARATYERALAIDRELGDGDAEAKVLNSLAIVHAEQGRFDEARDPFRERARDQPRARRSPPGRSRARQPRILNIEQGRLGPGASNREAALAIHRDTGERIEEGKALTNMPSSIRPKAVSRPRASNFFAALAIARDAGNRRHEGIVLGSWARSKASRAGSTQARLHYDQALAIHRAVGNRRYEGAVLGSSADLLARQGRVEEARAFSGARRSASARRPKLELAGLLCLRGRLELAAGEPARAQASLAEADSGARALDLDADSKLWKEIAALRDAIDGGDLLLDDSGWRRGRDSNPRRAI